jgi:acetyltransferase-like isoleucine patch superfamily enzyme
MNNNAKLNLNGIFGFNKLLVGKVNVEPNIIDNTLDIKYIYNNVLTSLQNQITTTVRNALNSSEVITTINNTLTNFQTSLSNQVAKEASDVSTLQRTINTNYTTIDNKYSQLVTNLANNQTGLQTQITTLATQQANSTIGLDNANTWTKTQTFSGGLSVTNGPTTISRDMTIGANSNRLLTVNATPTFNSGLTVASGSVSFPSKSIDASCINNFPTGVSLLNANTWSEIQTFSKGISTNGVINSGLLTVAGDTLLGTSSADSLSINATALINSTPIFSKGLTVRTGPIFFPTQSIPSTCITGLLSLSNANTWTGLQTFTNGISVSGGDVSITRNTTLGDNSTRLLTVNATPTFNSGLIVSSGTISVPNSSLPIASISGLNTQLNSIQSSITSQVTKEASDYSDLLLKINTISLTPGAKGDKGDTGPQGPAGPTGASQLATANTWTALQTFDSGLTVSGGPVSITRDTTIGANSNRLLTVNATPTFNSGLTVASGTISVPDNSIPISAINA